MFFSFCTLPYLCSRKTRNGTLTEWLGSGLQNRVQQFESARYLTVRKFTKKFNYRQMLANAFCRTIYKHFAFFGMIICHFPDDLKKHLRYKRRRDFDIFGKRKERDSLWNICLKKAMQNLLRNCAK